MSYYARGGCAAVTAYAWTDVAAERCSLMRGTSALLPKFPTAVSFYACQLRETRLACYRRRYDRFAIPER